MGKRGSKDLTSPDDSPLVPDQQDGLTELGETIRANSRAEETRMPKPEPGATGSESVKVTADEPEIVDPVADDETGDADTEAKSFVKPPTQTVVASASIVNQGPGAHRPNSEPPPRPEMSLDTPAPVLVDIPQTKTIAFARIAWLVSIAMGVAAILFAVFSSATRLAALTATMTETATDQDAETIGVLASLLFWVALGTLIAIVVIESIVLAVVLKGRGGARWALVPIILIPHFGALLLADAGVAMGEGGIVISILVIAQWFVALVATALLFFPGANQWFGAKREARAKQSV